MSFVLTEEQEAIRAAARDLARGRLPVAHLRALRDEGDPLGFSREAWRELGELGFAGATVAEAHGGAGLGLVEAGLVLEELGRTLAPTPLLSTTVLAAGALALGDNAALAAEWLPKVASGEAVLALASDEGTRHRRFMVEARADRRGGELVLSGVKTMVLDGHAADAIVVAARTSGGASERGGVTLALVRRGAPGLAIERRSLLDHRFTARVALEGVSVPLADVVGEVGGGGELLDRALDRGAAALAAEQLGGALEAFDQTVAYLKERRQFGAPIGSFQALKHRAAWMFCELELTKSIVRRALAALDEGAPDAPALASAAKARASEVYVHVAAEAVQMHGGIGVTDEHDIGLFYKRARVTELLLGAPAMHRDRFGLLSGY
jgi:alkylation response protein AidB-like acyl-CoA dehydrogenase